MKIGHLKAKYPEIRTIIDKSSIVTYIYENDYNNLYFYKYGINKVLSKFKLCKESINDRFKHKSIIKNKFVDLYHFFNHIEMGDSDYITTFESCVPRIDEVLSITRNSDFLNNNIDDNTRKIIQKEMLKINSDNCKKLIAISNCTKEIQLALLDFCSKDVKKNIEKKIVVIHPPQKLHIESYEEKKKNTSKDLTFMFVGKAFHGKGGYETVKAFDNISKKFKNIRLVLVGNLCENLNYVKSLTQKEIDEIKLIISQNSKITHYNNLSNREVINLMKKSDVGLLPTWADTYGYSVLEFQSCGCPVISSNARALTEINNNEVGWIIDMPLTKLKEINFLDSKNINYIRSKFISELERLFIEIIENPCIIEIKSELSIRRIDNMHNPQKYDELISEIYREVKL
ncbi:MAG: glycosyltransferase [Paraclostridium bifermentans]|uniref:glycosyltransferase n=1 Tax=Paraclostridium bifermentans TaxID=1490 RepID=UPI001D61E288|nr:glycosyltransferase [Paraclostridium bifermentans]MBS6509125.1 glycosyltransferase [Paraclostridium bifermentans]